MHEPSIQTIDAYIEGYPKDVRKLLQQMRKAIHRAAPTATETITYGIPTFVLGKNLVHFGGFATHIGFYPTPSGITAFKKELSAYTLSKGTVQFPLDQPLPIVLIEKIVRYRVKEHLRYFVKKPVPHKRVKSRK